MLCAATAWGVMVRDGADQGTRGDVGGTSFTLKRGGWYILRHSGQLLLCLLTFNILLLSFEQCA